LELQALRRWEWGVGEEIEVQELSRMLYDGVGAGDIASPVPPTPAFYSARGVENDYESIPICMVAVFRI
jgi:hypothetical protein